MADGDAVQGPHENGRRAATIARRVAIHSVGEAILKIWYVYAVLTVVTWGVWGVFSKLASNYSKPKQALLFQTVGVLAFAVVVLFIERFRLEWSLPGFSWAAVGGFCIHRILDVLRGAGPGKDIDGGNAFGAVSARYNPDQHRVSA